MTTPTTPTTPTLSQQVGEAALEPEIFHEMNMAAIGAWENALAPTPTITPRAFRCAHDKRHQLGFNIAYPERACWDGFTAEEVADAKKLG